MRRVVTTGQECLSHECLALFNGRIVRVAWSTTLQVYSHECLALQWAHCLRRMVDYKCTLTNVLRFNGCIEVSRGRLRGRKISRECLALQWVHSRRRVVDYSAGVSPECFALAAMDTFHASVVSPS